MRFRFSDAWTAKLKSILDRVGYDHLHWTRTVAYARCSDAIEALGASSLDVLEIAAGHYWQKFNFRSYERMDYPEYDICVDRLNRQFDLIIADNVFEHLTHPYRAARNVYDMLRPGGMFMIITPFLIRVHDVPIDCSRWTEVGLKYFLAECGFDFENIETGSWGNRSCVRANFQRWARRGWFGSLRNEKDFPVTVWAFARRSHE